MPQDELFPLMTHFKKKLLDQRSKYTYRISPRKVRAWMMSMFDKSFATLQDKLWNDLTDVVKNLGDANLVRNVLFEVIRLKI